MANKAWGTLSGIERQFPAARQIVVRKRLIVVAISACFASAPAWSNPTGPQVVNGAASFNQAGSQLTVSNSNGAIINWNTFSIGAGETTRFNQTSAASSVLNRVLANDPSVLLGTLSSNGRVWLVNPAGILVGQGARIDVAGFVASTLYIANQDFLANRLNFQATPNAGSVQNYGQITTPSGGSVYLIAPAVENHGIINAPNGEVILAAGQTVQLIDTGTPGVSVAITGAEGNVTNLGQIVSDAGRIGLAGVLVRNSGTLNASSVVSEGGRIFLRANQDAYVDGAGRIVATGTKGGSIEVLGNNVTMAEQAVIDASGQQQGGGNILLKADMSLGTTTVAGGLLAKAGARGGDGGFIETSGAHVRIADSARVSTLAPNGNAGTWLIDPNDYTVAASGGDTTGTLLSTNLGTTNVTLQSSSGNTAGSGNVNINDTVSWSANTTLTLTASNNVNVNANVAATGATAGIAINPNTANGSETASGTGTINLGAGASINLPNVSPTSTTALVISGTPYTVINSLGVQSSATGTDLQGMSGNLSGHYALGSNIDATATGTWNSSAGFTPVGTSSTPFTGIFDGLGHTIGNLTINLPSTSYVGLLGYVGTGGVAKNVGLVGGTVAGVQYVGELAGYSSGGTIGNSYATGAVTGSYYQIGGLVGYNLGGGTVSNSYATGPVTGANHVGGLVGENGVLSGSGGTVSNSYATGTVTGSGSFNAGGLVGVNYGQVTHSYATGVVSGVSNFTYLGGLVGYNGGTISNSYATGAVTGPNNSWYGGGLVGSNGGTVNNSYAIGAVSGSTSTDIGGLMGFNYGTVTNSYATGAVSGSSNINAGGLVGINTLGGSISNSYATGAVAGTTSIGGLVGNNDLASTVSNSFWNSDVIAVGIGANIGTLTNVIGLTTAQMQTMSSFTGWNIANTGGAGMTWRIYEGSTAPLITSFLKPLTVTAMSGSKVYDGTTAGIGVSYSLTPDMSKLLGTLSAAAASKNVGAYTVTPAGFYSNQQGYDVSYVNGALTITPASLTLSGLSAANKVYDGTTFASLSGGSLSGLIAGDVVSFTGSGSFVDKNAGVAKPVTISGIPLTGADAGNYTLVQPAGLSANITQRPLSTWIGGASGNWSVASNWDVLPDLSNVLAVSVPTGKSVTYDAAAGSTNLASLTAAGLNMAGGSLNIANSLTVNSSFSQTGGTLSFGAGANASITQASGNLNLAALTVSGLSLSALAGAITQSGSIIATTLNTHSQTGTTLTNAGNQVSSFTATNSGSGNIALTNTVPLSIGGISNSGGNIAVDNTGGVTTVGAVSAPAGAVSIVAHSPLAIGTGGVLAGGNIILTAGGTSVATDNMTLNGTIQTTGSAGSIALTAGGSIMSVAGFSGPNLIGDQAFIVAGGNASLSTEVRLLDVNVRGTYSIFDFLTGTYFTNVPSTSTLPVLNQVLSMVSATIQQSTPQQPTQAASSAPTTTPGLSGTSLLSDPDQTVGGAAGMFGDSSTLPAATSDGSAPTGSSGTASSTTGPSGRSDMPAVRNLGTCN